MMEESNPSAAPAAANVPPDAPTIGYGRYVLVSKIAEGGMASVYRAWDHKLRVWRAIKVLSQDYARRSVLRGRFETEAKTMARIDDPNVIQVYDVGTREALPYMVMELAEGGTVNHWVETHGRMPPRMAVSVVLQAARGLHAAHLLGVVHRDVKPHNLLVTADGQCKVADFGIARVLMEEGEDVTRTGAAMGTIGYMAPEQKIDARSVDPRADIYGLGALLYKLVHGRIVSDLFLVEHRATLLDGLPDALRPIVLTACYHDRERRFNDAPSLIRALREAMPKLPELPPDTPSLVMPMLASMRDYTAGFPEIGPLIGNDRRSSPIPLPYTMSRPLRQVRVTEDSDEPSYVVVSTPPPTPSSPATVPPESRSMTNTIVPEGGPPTREELAAMSSPTAVPAWGIAAGVGLVGCLFLMMMMALLGAYSVSERRAERDVARAALYDAATQERSLLQDLASRGATRTDVQRLAQLYDAFVATEGEPGRSAAAAAYIDGVRTVSRTVLVATRGETDTASPMTLVKVRNLERAWAMYVEANQRLDRTSAALPGWLAVSSGLTAAPQPRN
jgi:serine/threonine protein kinase